MKYALYSAVAIILLIPLITMLKNGSFIKNLFISAFQGIASLLAVNALGLLTGVTIALNAYTATATAILGLPACISFLILDVILK